MTTPTNRLWTFSELWNKSLEQRDSRPVTPRSNLWASELGKQDLDIYLKLIGEVPTNDFDARALRKFEAGNLFEWIVKIVLIRIGVYGESQKYIKFKKSPESLEVTGRLDHLAGGKPNYEDALASIGALELPEMFTKAAVQIINYFKETYPDGLPEQGIEVKSTSSYGIEKVYATGHALAGHDLQAFHYAFNTGIPFIILYICRDDLRMADIPVLPDDEELKARYFAKIDSISDWYNKKQEPPKEPEIVFDERDVRFSKNFNVEYSAYLTRNYKYPTPADFDDATSSLVMAFNRVLGRIKEGKEMTKDNEEKLGRMQEMGFDVEKIKKLITKE